MIVSRETFLDQLPTTTVIVMTETVDSWSFYFLFHVKQIRLPHLNYGK